MFPPTAGPSSKTTRARSSRRHRALAGLTQLTHAPSAPADYRLEAHGNTDVTVENNSARDWYVSSDSDDVIQKNTVDMWAGVARTSNVTVKNNTGA